MKEQFAEESPQSTIYTARFENLNRVRGFVAQAAETCGLDPKAVYQVQLAVDEAFTNVVEHAYGGECDEKVQCSYQIQENGLMVAIRDCGQIFNPKNVPEPDLEADLEERKVGGLGLYFIRQLMDEVEFVFVPETGSNKGCNVLRMFKKKE